MRYPDRLNALRLSIGVEYPSLHINIDNSRIFLRGALFIFDQPTGEEIDHYEIEIELPENYPKSIPIVREIGGRLPKIADRHFNSACGEACLFLPDERFKYYPEGTSISDFIKSPVTQFFVSQTYYELTHQWPFGQRSHGTLGIEEFYKELLHTNNPKVVLTFLEFLSRKEVKGHHQCYCRSGKKIKNCHLSKMVDARLKIDRITAQGSLSKYKEYISQNSN